MKVKGVWAWHEKSVLGLKDANKVEDDIAEIVARVALPELPHVLRLYLEKLVRVHTQFHNQRWDALQEYQRELPEPYRTYVCDILANGSKRTWPVTAVNEPQSKQPKQRPLVFTTERPTQTGWYFFKRATGLMDACKIQQVDLDHWDEVPHSPNTQWAGPVKFEETQ